LDIIIGDGEVGSALSEILDIPAFGENPPDAKEVRFLHIAFPYTDKFCEYVRGYQDKYLPGITIIHSTVKPGTSKSLRAIHSPIFGKHPDLAPDIKRYPKFIGYDFEIDGLEVYIHFKKAGLSPRLFSSPTTTELFKIFSTSTLGINVAWAQEMERICGSLDVEYEDWKVFEGEINKGLIERGLINATRPVLDCAPIGGHCVLPNFEILLKTYKSEFIKLAILSNEEAKCRTSQKQ